MPPRVKAKGRPSKARSSGKKEDSTTPGPDSTVEVSSSAPTPARNLLSDTVATGEQQTNEAAATDNNPQRSRNCAGCARDVSKTSCCLENLKNPHPCQWSFLQPMIRHNCIVYDRNNLTETGDIGKPVLALYPELFGMAAHVEFMDTNKTILQAPIFQLPEELRYVLSITVFENGMSFCNDPVGWYEFGSTGKVVSDAPAHLNDEQLAAYRTYWDTHAKQAVIGRKSAEAQFLINTYSDTNPQTEHLKAILEARNMTAVNHQPGDPWKLGAGSLEHVAYNPRVLPKLFTDETIDIDRAIEGATAINYLQDCTALKSRLYLPTDFTDMLARSGIPLINVVELASIDNIMELVPDAAHTRGIDHDGLRFGSKMLVIVAMEQCRTERRADTYIISTLRRLVIHGDTLEFTKEMLNEWRSQLTSNKQYARFFWIMSIVLEKDPRGMQLMQMILENDGRLWETQRDDEMDTLGLMMTLEEMLRIAHKAMEEERDGEMAT